jgi:hypothetical protein
VEAHHLEHVAAVGGASEVLDDKTDGGRSRRAAAGGRRGTRATVPGPRTTGRCGAPALPKVANLRSAGRDREAKPFPALGD